MIPAGSATTAMPKIDDSIVGIGLNANEAVPVLVGIHMATFAEGLIVHRKPPW